MNIILASKSQRRKDLLKMIDIPFRSYPSNFDESTISNKNLKPIDLCKKLAFLKAKKISQKFKSDLEYVETRSIFLDIRIIFKTFIFLIVNSNNYDENIIAKRFKGKE